MIENVSTQLTVFHCFAHCLLPGRAFASLYALLFLEKEAEIGGRDIMHKKMFEDTHGLFGGGGCPQPPPPPPLGPALAFCKNTYSDRAKRPPPFLKSQYLFTIALAMVIISIRLVPHVDKAPLPLRILRLVTSNFLPVENPTHPTAHAPERASVYILGQFRTSK